MDACETATSDQLDASPRARPPLPLCRHSGTLNHTAAHGRNQNRDRSARQGQSRSAGAQRRRPYSPPARLAASWTRQFSQRSVRKTPLPVGGMYGQPRAAERIGGPAFARRETPCPRPTEIQPIAATGAAPFLPNVLDRSVKAKKIASVPAPGPSLGETLRHAVQAGSSLRGAAAAHAGSTGRRSQSTNAPSSGQHPHRDVQSSGSRPCRHSWSASRPTTPASIGQRPPHASIAVVYRALKLPVTMAAPTPQPQRRHRFTPPAACDEKDHPGESRTTTKASFARVPPAIRHVLYAGGTAPAATVARATRLLATGLAASRHLLPVMSPAYGQSPLNAVE